MALIADSAKRGQLHSPLALRRIKSLEYRQASRSKNSLVAYRQAPHAHHGNHDQTQLMIDRKQ